jgi:hypothetical protein
MIQRAHIAALVFKLSTLDLDRPQYFLNIVKQVCVHFVPSAPIYMAWRYRPMYFDKSLFESGARHEHDLKSLFECLTDHHNNEISKTFCTQR